MTAVHTATDEKVVVRIVDLSEIELERIKFDQNRLVSTATKMQLNKKCLLCAETLLEKHQGELWTSKLLLPIETFRIVDTDRRRLRD